IFKIKSKCAFVSTNSIVQGEQANLLWPILFEFVEIDFAYPSFKWINNAKNQAGVSVVIIGLRNFSKNDKYIITEKIFKVNNINQYLIDSNSVIIQQSNVQISNLPEMQLGSSGIDGNNLVIENEVELELIQKKKFIKKFVGGNDIINNTNRYCLWIKDEDLDEALEDD